MSLYEQLQKAKSEEDVKDAYIKVLGLKGHTKGLIDIQSKEIWFEAAYKALGDKLRPQVYSLGFLR
jgi:hypothetical protein